MIYAACRSLFTLVIRPRADVGNTGDTATATGYYTVTPTNYMASWACHTSSNKCNKQADAHECVSVSPLQQQEVVHCGSGKAGSKCVIKSDYRKYPDASSA